MIFTDVMAMQINTAQLLKQAAGSSRSYKIDDTIGFAEEGIAKCHVQGKVELIRTDKGILVKGILEGNSSLICNRCLTLFDYPLNFGIEEEFFPSTDVISGNPLSLPEDSTIFIIDKHHILDLNEAVRQYALLAMPMKPLCRPDCAGLCPSCGVNLNQGACYCVPLSQKSPWSELKKLI
jgi:uncharacterized protein